MVCTGYIDFVILKRIKRLAFFRRICYNERYRKVAQPGRALRSGRRGREFESHPSDQLKIPIWVFFYWRIISNAILKLSLIRREHF